MKISPHHMARQAGHQVEPLLFVVLMGMVAAIAIPNWLRIRAMQQTMQCVESMSEAAIDSATTTCPMTHQPCTHFQLDGEDRIACPGKDESEWGPQILLRDGRWRLVPDWPVGTEETSRAVTVESTGTNVSVTRNPGWTEWWGTAFVNVITLLGTLGLIAHARAIARGEVPLRQELGAMVIATAFLACLAATAYAIRPMTEQLQVDGARGTIVRNAESAQLTWNNVVGLLPIPVSSYPRILVITQLDRGFKAEVLTNLPTRDVPVLAEINRALAHKSAAADD